ncbi:MAG: peptidoglycan-binding protein [Anaerolineales bacterium]
MRKLSLYVHLGLFLAIIFSIGCSGSTQTPALSETGLPQVTDESRIPTHTSSPTQTAFPTSSPEPTPPPLPTQDPFVISAQNDTQLEILTNFGGPPVGKITSLDWSLNGNWLHVSGPSGAVIYHADTFELQHVFPDPEYFSFLKNGDEYAILQNGQLQIFETPGGNLNQEYVLPDLSGGNFLISPTGRYLAANTFPNQFSIWDLGSGEMAQTVNLGEFFEFDLEVIANKVFNSDGSSLFVATNAGGLYQIDMASGAVERLYRAVFVPDPTIVSNTPAECFSPGANGHHLVLLCAKYTPSADYSRIASTYFTLKWLDLNHGDHQLTSFETRNSFSNPSLSPDGKALYLQGIGEFKLLELTPQGVEILTTPDCLAHSVDPFSLSPSGLGKVAVINSYERGEIFLCDVLSGEKGIAINFEPLSSLAVGIVGDGYAAAVGRCSGEIELWDPEKVQMIEIIPAHDGCVNDLQFSRDGQYLASGGEDGQVALWDVGTQNVGPLFNAAHNNPIEDLVLNHDGKYLASVSRTELQLWDTSSGEQLFSKDLAAGKNVTLGRRDWVVVSDGNWVNWYARDGLFTSQFIDTGHLLVDPGSKFISALSPSNDWIGFFDLDRGNEIYSFDLQSYPVQSIALSLDGCLLIGIGEYEQIVFWTLNPFTLVGTIDTRIERDNRVIAAGTSPDGRLILLGLEDGSVQVWGSEGALNAIPGQTTTREFCDRISRPIPTATGVPTATRTPTLVPPTPAPAAFTRNLYLTQPNLQGGDVLALQERLLTLGYVQVGVPDGVFGSLTDQAVRQFQADSGLAVDGVVGPQTWSLLFPIE